MSESEILFSMIVLVYNVEIIWKRALTACYFAEGISGMKSF